jgi:hypothetical protein
MPCELGSGIVADRMRRCVAVTSVNELLLEVDEVLDYLKSHNGIVDQPINGNNNIIEESVMTAPAVGTATDTRDLRGCIPTANEIDTPTVAATPTMRLRMVQNILPNDSAPKLTHSTSYCAIWTYSPSIQGS